MTRVRIPEQASSIDFFAPNLGIFWISVLGLFLELLLIRWVSTEIRIFAYLQNTVLVVCFLGLGAGLFTARRRISTGQILWPLLGLTSLLAFPFTRHQLQSISQLLSVLGDTTIWYSGFAISPVETITAVTLGLALTFLVMALVVEPFIPIGRLLGRLMDNHPRPIFAYSINVLGSLLGIWLFVLLSWFHGSPLIWFVVLCLLLLPFFARRRPSVWAHALPLALILVLSRFTTEGKQALETVWSPYQKLALHEEAAPGGVGVRRTIQVNNVGYQIMLDLRPETIEQAPEAYPVGQVGFSQYDIPFLLHPDARSALLVGAGSGNDAAGALRHGVERITAVEIDPAIVEFGRRYHPEQPYSSDRVRLVVDDARSFFARTAESYDVIVFGLLDSHTTTAMTNARLDHYVYTRESIGRAAELLEPGGVMVLSFEAQKRFISDRMAGVLRDVFGEEPIAFRVPNNELGWGGVLFVAGDLAAVRDRISSNPRLRGQIASWQALRPIEPSYTTALLTDDWPYIYLESRRIPLLYLLLAGLLGLLALNVRNKHGGAGLSPLRWRRSSWHFFFLGAAFLLLEVQNISKASVALGNTWLVNAVIISGVLCMVLLANLIVSLWPRIPSTGVYAALLGSTIGLYFVDLARFAFLPFGAKALVVGALSTLPMMFSGIVFVRSFTLAPRKDRALGANLLGALTGALLQSVSFLTGIKALLLIVAAFYTLALLTRRQVAVERTQPALDVSEHPVARAHPAEQVLEARV